MPTDEETFPSVEDIPMMPQIYEDGVLRAVLTLNMMAKRPEESFLMDGMISMHQSPSERR